MTSPTSDLILGHSVSPSAIIRLGSFDIFAVAPLKFGDGIIHHGKDRGYQFFSLDGLKDTYFVVEHRFNVMLEAYIPEVFGLAYGTPSGSITTIMVERAPNGLFYPKTLTTVINDAIMTAYESSYLQLPPR